MMMKVQEIREIIRLIDQSSIQEFSYENEGTVISLKKGGGVVVQPEVKQVPVEAQAEAPVIERKETMEKSAKPVERPAATERKEELSPGNQTDTEGLHKIESPMVGTFYSAPSPEDPPYVKVGDKVSEDTVVCIVEAMKLFNEIEAEVKGEIVEVLVENGQLVEYGQPLFLVKPE